MATPPERAHVEDGFEGLQQVGGFGIGHLDLQGPAADRDTLQSKRTRNRTGRSRDHQLDLASASALRWVALAASLEILGDARRAQEPTRIDPVAQEIDGGDDVFVGSSARYIRFGKLRAPRRLAPARTGRCRSGWGLWVKAQEADLDELAKR